MEQVFLGFSPTSETKETLMIKRLRRPTMKTVRKLADNLRGALADCEWKKEEVYKLELEISDFIGFVLDLPLSGFKKKLSLENKLAIAAAHASLPLCDEFEKLVEREGGELDGSMSALREARSIRLRLTANLAAFIALSGGI